MNGNTMSTITAREMMNIRNIIVHNGSDEEDDKQGASYILTDGGSPSGGSSGNSSGSSNEDDSNDDGNDNEEKSSQEEGDQQQEVNGGILGFQSLQHFTNLNQTPFANKTDLAADYQGSSIILSSDDTFGPATNLIKTVATEPHTNVQPNEEDEFRDGWLVRRHENLGFATIKFGVSGTIRGIDIDLTGYTQCAPLRGSVHGYMRGRSSSWTPLVDNAPLVPNSHNFFEIRNNNERQSHVHITVSPGGGVTRLRCYGDVDNSNPLNHMEVNLASTKLGAEIVEKPADIVRGEFPNLIINRKESNQDGWISPRSFLESDFTIIKLAGEGKIDRIVVDTMHFIGNAPLSVSLEGCCIIEQEGIVDPDSLSNAHWINLIAGNDETNYITPNSFNVLPCIYAGSITHIRFRPIPDGGVQQIMVKGNFYSTNAELPQQPKVDPPKKRKRNDENDDIFNDENDEYRRKSTRTRRPVSRFQ